MPDEQDPQAPGQGEPTEGVIIQQGENEGSNSRAEDPPPDDPDQPAESAGTGEGAAGAESGEEGDEPPQKDGIVMEF